MESTECSRTSTTTCFCDKTLLEFDLIFRTLVGDGFSIQRVLKRSCVTIDVITTVPVHLMSKVYMYVTI